MGKSLLCSWKKSTLPSVALESLKLYTCSLCELTRISKWCLWVRQLPPDSAVYQHQCTGSIWKAQHGEAAQIPGTLVDRSWPLTSVYPPGTRENRFVRVCLFYSSNYERLIGNVYCWETNWECLFFTCLFIFFLLQLHFCPLPIIFMNKLNDARPPSSLQAS